MKDEINQAINGPPLDLKAEDFAGPFVDVREEHHKKVLQL